MFKLFKNSGNFCDVPIKPWIFILFFCCIIVLFWGIYQNDPDPEAIAENLSQNISGNESVLTNFPSNQQIFQPGLQQQAPDPALPYSNQILQDGSNLPLSGNSLHTFENTIKGAIASVRPSVVNIKSTRINGTANQNGSYESIGSGLIVSSTGHILTNYHVIANAQNIVISVYGMGRKSYRARVLDHHIDTDLTLLKLETTEMFTPAALGNSDLVETGDMVIAIGSPFGMDQTVTSGIVSGVHKSLVIGGVTYNNMIQTDAPINRGSSGGPLVNIDGQVIGINTAIYAPTGVFSGTAFAMPVNRIKRFLTAHNIVSAGGFQQAGFTDSFSNIKGWLGVEIQSVDQTIALHLGLPYIGGVLVNRVLPDSPAMQEGIERGDVILEINGNKIVDIDNFESIMDNAKPDDMVEALVYSGKELRQFFLRLSQFSGYNR